MQLSLPGAHPMQWSPIQEASSLLSASRTSRQALRRSHRSVNPGITPQQLGHKIWGPNWKENTNKETLSARLLPCHGPDAVSSPNIRI